VAPGTAAATPHAATNGTPMLVGAASEQPRARSLGDTTAVGAAVDDTVGSEDGVAAGEDRYGPDELRDAPQAAKRFRGRRRSRVLAVVLALFALIGKLAYDWSQDQYYVGESDGVVAIYQGVPQEVPGIDLSDVDSPTSISLDSLPTYS